MNPVREELLHHIWKFRLFKQTELTTTDGQSVEILKPGEWNTDAGPDFLNARVQIDGLQLAGNVEIHIKASDWLAHGHQHDAAYSNIILHVVFENDLEESVGDFPTIELKERVSDQVLLQYVGLMHAREPIACGHRIKDVASPVFNNWLERLLVDRLQRKSAWMTDVVDQCKGDLEQAFFIIMARTMGMKVNADAFEQLARRLPWKVLVKHRDSLLQLEALLFGAAGLIPTDSNEEHPAQLRQEFQFLQHKYGIEQINPSTWRYLRLRPANFPTVRIAQLAAMVHNHAPLLQWYSGHFTKDHCPSVLAQPSPYWDTHYSFKQESATRRKPLGATMQRHILINAVAPYLMVLAEREHRPELREKALEILYSMEGEKNARIHPFRELGLKISNAATAQALLELRSHWCDHRKCLHCTVGNQLLKKTA